MSISERLQELDLPKGQPFSVLAPLVIPPIAAYVSETGGLLAPDAVSAFARYAAEPTPKLSHLFRDYVAYRNPSGLYISTLEHAINQLFGTPDDYKFPRNTSCAPGGALTRNTRVLYMSLGGLERFMKERTQVKTIRVAYFDAKRNC